jgi:branched-chain amino acid transport system permease protein
MKMKFQRAHLFRYAPVGIIVLLTLPLYVDLSIVSLFYEDPHFWIARHVASIFLSAIWALGFSHAAFFGLAAYTVAVLGKHFAVTNFWLAASRYLHGGVRRLYLRSCRTPGIRVYFLLITLAMGQLVYGIVHTSVGPLGR